jgi:hypothetical protein
VAEGTPVGPTMADQVSRLYELIAGYHATNLLEVARELGVWEALARALKPGGHFLIFDEVYPETDEALRAMPTRFSRFHIILAVKAQDG